MIEIAGKEYMPKTKRFKISLPNGETLWLSGQTVSEAFLDGWEKYSDKTESVAGCISVNDFINNVYKPTNSFSTGWQRQEIGAGRRISTNPP